MIAPPGYSASCLEPQADFGSLVGRARQVLVFCGYFSLNDAPARELTFPAMMR